MLVSLSSLASWQKEKQLETFNGKREEPLVEVVRDGQEQLIHVHTLSLTMSWYSSPARLFPAIGYSSVVTMYGVMSLDCAVLYFVPRSECSPLGLFVSYLLVSIKYFHFPTRTE